MPRAVGLTELAEALFLRVPVTLRLTVLGHSMGGLVGYELTRLLCAAGRPPELLIVAATRPPRYRLDASLAAGSYTNDDEYLTVLHRAGIVPAQLLTSPLRAMVVPALRADLLTLASYQPDNDAPALPVDLQVWRGRDDPVTPPGIVDAWAEYTSKTFRVRVFEGGHFFLDGLAARDGLLGTSLSPNP